MEAAKRRVSRLQSQLNPAVSLEPCSDVIVEQKGDQLKWNGWGFSDTAFKIDKDGHVYLSGDRYELCGTPLPHFRPWIEEKVAIDIREENPAQGFDDLTLPTPIRNEAFLAAIRGQVAHMSSEKLDRVHHAHGHTCQEVYELRHGGLARYPDIVVWPSSHEEVEAVVKAAHQHNVVVIPFGGGTSVSNAVMCPAGEKRMIVSLDTAELNQVLWVSTESMTACLQAGMNGRQVEAALRQHGVMLGHEPDSSEFSTVGGWVATRASGMKKNIYGNIEDLLVSVRFVTPVGTLQKSVEVPRISAGPDLHHVVLGSEGTLGVVTEAVFKVRPIPRVRVYGAIIFPDFESGVQCLREVAYQRCAPASIRLVDNTQFQMGQALKPAAGWFKGVMDKAKKYYVTVYQGYKVDEMCAATLLFEGDKEAELKAQQAKVYAIAARFHGMKADEDNGRRGYALTFMIAYIRDLGFQHWFVAESFETSAPWSAVLPLCARVKQRIRDDIKKHGIPWEPLISCRVTQVYDAGACIYFYFGFKSLGVDDPMGKFTAVEHGAREEILACGGSISHHHGVGKHRKDFMAATVSDTGISLLKGIKASLDPKNVFASGNLV